MSASPAPLPSGPSSVTPGTGGPPTLIQRKKAATSIFQPKKKPTRNPGAVVRSSKVPTKATNGVQQRPGSQPVNGAKAAPAIPTEPKEPEDFMTYPIVISKSMLDRGLRHHAFRIQSKSEANGSVTTVNPYDTSQFTRPVHLYRRLAGDKQELAERSDAASGVDDKERELVNAKRAERQAEREANQALIAPTGGDNSKTSKRKKPQKKVEDVYYDQNNPKHVARSQLRYEESRPWHLEDFDNKNKFVGTYAKPLSNTSVMFVVDDAGFKMVPVEKWYKMASVSKAEKKLDSEQIEKNMSQKYAMPRWFMGTQEGNKAAQKQAFLLKREQQQQQSAVKRGRGSDEEDAPYIKKEDYQADVDEIDFEFNDEFQDDDEGFVFGDPDDKDEAKEIEKKIREEMRTANLPGTGFRDETRDWDAEEQQEKNAEMEERRKQKKMRKQLQKKERRNEYESDSEDNKYESSSEDEDSEEERERLEKERKEEEARKVAQTNGDKSDVSTKGTNTPTGRSEKKPVISLKRDADLSELSGNESSRKKAKRFDGRTMSSSALNAARSLSPDAAKRVPSGYGSGSETDTSRPGRPHKLKNSPSGSPVERSPNASRTTTPLGSRAQSPKPLATPVFPTLDEVKAAIPKDGIVISQLVQLFRTRVAGRNQDFITLVRKAGRQDAATKKIMPKD